MTPQVAASKIAIASSGLGHVARGNESWAEDLGRALADRGESVIICKGGGRAEADYERVIPCWRREQARTAKLLGFVPRRVGWRVGLGSPYEVEQSTFAIGLLGVLRREDVAIVHVQDPVVASIVQRARRMGLTRARAILAHGTEEPADFLRKVNYLQHLAPWHLEQARAVGLWKPTWTAIPNFVDTETYRPGRSDAIRDELGIPRDALVVMSAAAIRRPHKRVDVLIDEFARFREARPDLPAWLVVAGGWDRDTDGLVAEGLARLGDRVRFLVRFPRGRMADLYRAADLFALCSLSEMLGIVLLEASASGLPCLVHPHPVLEWVVGPGGRSIPMDGPGMLASAMADLLSDPEARRAMGGRARDHAVGEFGRERIVDRIVAYYAEVLDGQASGPAQ